MNLAYQLFHINGVSVERDDAAAVVQATLNLSSLNSPTMSSETPFPFNLTKQFKPGEVGLWHSTIVALKNFLDSDFDALLILEDDIVLWNGFLEKSREYVERLPEHWDYFYQYVHPWQQDNNFNPACEIGDEYLCRSYQVWSNACFWVSKKGAQILLEAINKEPIDEAVDWYILKRGMTREWDVYSLRPLVKAYCHIGGFETTIQNG